LHSLSTTMDPGSVMVDPQALELGEQLGRGSSGTVTQARDRVTGLVVALKVVPITLRTGSEQVAPLPASVTPHHASRSSPGEARACVTWLGATPKPCRTLTPSVG
jgi:hypothetical protein